MKHKIKMAKPHYLGLLRAICNYQYCLKHDIVLEKGTPSIPHLLGELELMEKIEIAYRKALEEGEILNPIKAEVE